MNQLQVSYQLKITDEEQKEIFYLNKRTLFFHLALHYFLVFICTYTCEVCYILYGARLQIGNHTSYERGYLRGSKYKPQLLKSIF